MSTTDPEEDPEELRAFREKWRAEVQQKLQQQHHHDEPAAPADVKQPEPAPALVPAPAPALSHTHDPPKLETPFEAKQRRALEVYRAAIRHEQASELDDALRLYRQAFKLDPDVDRVYMRAEGLFFYSGAAPASYTSPSADASNKTHAKKPPEKHTHARTASVEQAGVDGIAGGMGAMRLSGSGAHQTIAHGERSASGALAQLLGAFPDELAFTPEDETAPVPLELLPDELLVFILGHLDWTALERFATVSKKARVLTLDASLWRPFVQAIYKPPQIPDDEAIEDILGLYDTDYRRTWIEHPRVRLDGVYIAVNQYIRPGLSENRWVNVSHLVTYHRYLRFYPSGQVISLLTNEDQEPQQVIRMLKPSLRMKGLYIGTWRLDGTTVHISNLTDPTAPSARHTFQMTLMLRSRPLGRWNRLDFREYESVSVEDGEVLALPLKKERPFWFSKVRSYA